MTDTNFVSPAGTIQRTVEVLELLVSSDKAGVDVRAVEHCKLAIAEIRSAMLETPAAWRNGTADHPTLELHGLLTSIVDGGDSLLASTLEESASAMGGQALLSVQRAASHLQLAREFQMLGIHGR